MHLRSWMVPEHTSSILPKLLALLQGLPQHRGSLTLPGDSGLMDKLIPPENTFNQGAMDDEANVLVSCL